MKYILPRNKGLITGAVMIGLSLASDKLQYVIYCLYVAGIIWTLLDYKRVAEKTPGFKDFFAQGFKMFIVVTLMMVVFFWVYLVLVHPELKDQWAANMRVEMSTMKDLVQSDIDARIEHGKKMFVPGYIMGVILAYLSIGALISVIGAGFLSQVKNDR